MASGLPDETLKPRAWQLERRATIQTFGTGRREQTLPEVKGRQDIRSKKSTKVPKCVKQLDFWRAMEYFDFCDTYKKGELDRKQWFKMLTAINLQAEQEFRSDINEETCNAMFDEVDVDGGGTIDKEEWLAWAYQTYSNYCKSIRKRLESLEPKKVITYFRQIDKDGNGMVDIDEFQMFVSKFAPDCGLSPQAVRDLFKFIDADKSGEIDVNEFLDWVHPERKMARAGLLQMPEPKKGGSSSAAELRKTSKKLGDVELPAASRNSSKQMPSRSNSLGASNTELNNQLGGMPQSDSKGGLFETRAGDPVPIEFTIGKDFELTLIGIKKEIRKEYDGGQVRFEVVYDNNISKCAKVEARVGRGIVLWDRPKMIQYMEDPFLTIESARRWISSVLAKTLPDLIKAASLDSRGPLDAKKKERKDKIIKKLSGIKAAKASTVE